MTKLEKQADLLFNNVAGWEQSALERIGKRVKKYGKMSLSDVKAINNIAVAKQDMKAITKELAKVTGKNIKEVEKMYGDLLEQQHLANKPLYDYRGKKFVPFAENKEMQAIVKRYAENMGGTMMNLSNTKLLKIIDADGNPVALQKGYTDILDRATMQVASGSTDFHTAMRDAIKQLGDGGMRVDYGNGITRRLDTVVRQNLMWGAKQASIAYNDMIGEELGCDGIEVDWHSFPRPSHEFMQGKQFILGKEKVINGVKFESADEALKRLEDYGCLHFKTPIICGISEPTFSQAELDRLNAKNKQTFEVDGKTMTGYEVTQAMRRLETAIRDKKTAKATAKASGDKVLEQKYADELAAYQEKYDQISDATGIAQDKT